MSETNLTQSQIIRGFEIILGSDAGVRSVKKNDNYLMMLTENCNIKIHQITDWIYMETRYLTIVINVTNFNKLSNDDVFCPTLTHFVKYWYTWSNILKNTGYRTLGEFQFANKKINNEGYIAVTPQVNFDIGSYFNVSWHYTNQMCIEKKNSKCYFSFTEDNLDYIMKSIKNFINKTTVDELCKIFPVETVKSNSFVNRAKNNGVILPDNFIDVTMAIDDDNYINFLITFDNSHVDDDTIKVTDVLSFLDFEDGVIKLKEIMNLANQVINLDDKTLETSPVYFTDLYRKIKNDTRTLNEEFERLNRSANIFCKQPVLLTQQELDPDQPNLDDLIQSEDYTQAFLKQICCIECIKDPTLIQYIEPTSKVDVSIQKYILATIKNKSSKLLEFSDIMQILKALIIV